MPGFCTDNSWRPVASYCHPHILYERDVSNPRPPRGTSDRDKTMSRLGRSRHQVARDRCYSCLLHIVLIDGSTIQWFVPWRPSLGLGLAVFCLSVSQGYTLPWNHLTWRNRSDRVPYTTLCALHSVVQLDLARWIHMQSSVDNIIKIKSGYQQSSQD